MSRGREVMEDLATTAQLRGVRLGMLRRRGQLRARRSPENDGRRFAQSFCKMRFSIVRRASWFR